MIKPKTNEEIAIMQEGGHKLREIKETLRSNVREGVTPIELDQLAEKLIFEAGGEPSFKMVRDYKWTTCININEGVVHGIPTKRAFKAGDIVSVDVGMFYKGFHTDTSFTVAIGEVDKETESFLKTGVEALNQAIKAVKAGNRISDVSCAMQAVLEAQGYSPVKALTGHGIGRKLHESPYVPIYWTEGAEDEIIPEGSTLAVEVIYTLGSSDLVLLEDSWTINTKDGKIASLYEETVVATANGPLVLTA